MSGLRTIKKYSNRRLYDLVESRYITFNELRVWIVDGIELRVIDVDTNEDITCAVLFTVMAAQEKRADPSMSRDFLLQAIRGSAEDPSWMIATFLEQSLNLFTRLHADRETRGDVDEKSALRRALHLAEANHQRWCAARSRINEVIANAKTQGPPGRGQPAPE